MNVNFLFSLPNSLSEYAGVKKLLADAAAVPVEESAQTGELAVPGVYCGCDPGGAPLGSGGGTVHLLHSCYLDVQRAAAPAQRTSFASWLRLADNDGRVIVHAGGLSRRLPAYASLGKALLPFPPCRWKRGGKLSRTLLSTQVPLYRALLAAAPANLRTVVACGDICLHVAAPLPVLSRFADADVLCFGLKADVNLFQNHGVFYASRLHPFDLDFMLQKPSVAELRERAAPGTHTCLLDVGLWMLSDRAVEVLARKCIGTALDSPSLGESTRVQSTAVCHPCDLYGEFGCTLGTHAVCEDAEATGLKACVVELRETEFLHYGTNRQIFSSTQTLQSCESPSPAWSWATPFDGILAPAGPRGVLPSPLLPAPEVSTAPAAVAAAADSNASTSANTLISNMEEPSFSAGDAMPLLATPSSVIAHNCVVLAPLDGSAAQARGTAAGLRPVRNLWVESSWIGARWVLEGGHIFTGIPRNDWALAVPNGVCISVVPVHTSGIPGLTAAAAEAVGPTPQVPRVYHLDDAFRGDVHSAATVYMGMPLHEWLSSRGFTVEELCPAVDGGGGRDADAHADAAAAGAGAPASAPPLDIYDAALFPVCRDAQQLGDFLYTATMPPAAVEGADAARFAAGQAVWRTQPRVSATDLLHLTDVPAVLRNTEYYERRMLAIALALATSDPASVSASSTPAHGAAAASTVVTGPMIALLQQQFFLLDLNHVAQRVVELGIALPAARGTQSSSADEPASRSTSLAAGAAPDPDALDVFATQQEVTHPSWAHIFVARSGPSGTASAAPLCSLPGRIIAAHYHMFVSRVVALTVRAMAEAEPAMSDAEAAACLARLRVASVADAKALAVQHDAAAFAELRASLMRSFPDDRHDPQLGVHLDQIIWGRSPIRIDLAGAWTDTPPYTILNGGSVINIAVELNGQPPVQVYVRVRRDPVIVMHSIDSGEQTTITSFDEIRTYATMQNPFSIPKAALALCGFVPEFCSTVYPSLRDQLEARFGGHGLEITLLVAIPTGSGLGTSSVVSGAVLQSLAEFCKLPWRTHDVCRRVLLMEQMLTAGGGWQDQYGGLFGGVKLVQSAAGLPCTPTVRWMPDGVFANPKFASRHLLYYTGVTRVAKGILEDVVRDVFLNDGAKLQLLHEIGGPQTAAMYDAITAGNYKSFARLVHRTWSQKKRLDDGVCNPQVQAIVDVVEPYVWGLTLPGAGGGGYMYMCAKDDASALAIRELLTANPPNANARFVEMTLSTTGMQISRS